MGRAYQYGIGVPLNQQSAISWYDKAAAQGHGQAQYFAKYLRDNHGADGSSRDDDERALLGPLMGRMFSISASHELVFITCQSVWLTFGGRPPTRPTGKP